MEGVINREFLENNSRDIEYYLCQFFHTRSIWYINALLKFINSNAYSNWHDILAAADMESQVILFLLSRYTMVLFSYLMNIKNVKEIKKIVVESNIIDRKTKSYMIKRYYVNIMNDAVSILKKFLLKNEQVNYIKHSKIIIWGFKERIKRFKPLLEFVTLNIDVISILQKFGNIKLGNEITINGKRYIGIADSWKKYLIKKEKSYEIRQDIWRIYIQFNKGNVAIIDYGIDRGFLAASGSVSEYVKKNNKWQKSRDLFSWIS